VELDFADPIDRDLVVRHGGLADQAVDLHVRRLLGQLEQLFTEQPQGDE
jgi:hypothetical protein